ncbi:2-dehydropantoate 2-reductase [Fodinisporobacter ferrooxydans]|uniref:2-dehydropantoate 2-reductase n=1 Tax=Fodinisporobacter ferrooxydans TaxID=2901836 RepID=A0ABY4CIC8_9BACL|nr:2-dehydropantoate 2-reductase [Alicyclobacillaceae bacterium MYW30-H2]
MKVYVVGAGAIGGVVGGYLSKAGYDITLADIAKEHIEAIKASGLTIDVDNQKINIPVKAIDAEEFARQECQNVDLVILAVKAQHTEQALRPIIHHLHFNSIVLSMQNGLCENVIASIIGKERTMGCFVNLFADYMEPGVIQYGGVGSLYIGELDGKITPRLEQIHQMLLAWGPAQMTNNIWGYLWSKLAYGAVLTATALVDETMADVIEPMENRELLFVLASETLSVANRLEISPMGFDDWEPTLIYPKETRDAAKLNDQWNTLIKRLRSYKKVKSGIWRDLAVRKRKTEVPYHLNPVIEQGKKLGISMELTKKVVSMIQEIENGSRKMSWNNIVELKNRIN